MIDLQLDITDLEDLQHEQNKFMEKELLDYGKKHLAAGNRIIIKWSYVNAPDDFIRAFTDQQQFETFWKSLFG
ncbi:hypothetical protein [Haliea atlantica]